MTYYEVYHPSTPSCDCYYDYFEDLPSALAHFMRYADTAGVILRVYRGVIPESDEEDVYSEFCG